MKKILLLAALAALCTANSQAMTYRISSAVEIVDNRNANTPEVDFGADGRFDIELFTDDEHNVSGAVSDFGTFTSEHITLNLFDEVIFRRFEGEVLWHVQLVDWHLPELTRGAIARANGSGPNDDLWHWAIGETTLEVVPDPVSTASVALLAFAGLVFMRNYRPKSPPSLLRA